MSFTAKPHFIVRETQLSDCEEVRQIWTEVSMVLNKYINELYLKIDPKGIFVAQDIKTGKLIGSGSGVNLSPELAFIGQYAVRPEYQGTGVGSEIWSKIMEHIGNERNISLYAVDDIMAKKYSVKSNFDIIPEKRLVHFIGKVNCNDLINKIEGISLVSINEDNIRDVIQYDKQVCDGLDRTVLIEELYKTAETVNSVAINENNEVIGYCVISMTNMNTRVVEPLYADSEQIAELLIGKCCQMLSNTTTYSLVYYCWNNNLKSMAIAHRMGLQRIRDQPILFTKRFIEGKVDKIYCISSRCSFPF